MTKEITITREQIDKLYNKLMQEAESRGYHLNPDIEFTKDLVRSLLVNEVRYGYQACPCRLARGIKEKDLDIICPCDYRDPDLDAYDTCYCGLYVSAKVLKGEKQIKKIPERRLPSQKDQQNKKIKVNITSLQLPVWRCKVCGYLCAREQPPETCPICKAEKERFEKFF